MRKAFGCGGGCIGSVFGLVGVIALIIGLVWGFNSWRRTQTNIETQGTVVDLVESRDSDGDLTYRPVIEFVARDGRLYVLRSNFGRSDPPSVGSTVGVYYDPDDPNDASESSWVALWLGPVILTVMGSIFAAIGVGSFVVGRLVARRAPRDDKRPSVVFEDTVLDEDPAFDNQPLPSEEPEFAAEKDRGDSFRAGYRGVEPSQPTADGRFRYRVVARTEDGATFYSEWLDSDPTMTLMGAGTKEVDVVWREGSYLVDVAWLE